MRPAADQNTLRGAPLRAVSRRDGRAKAKIVAKKSEKSGPKTRPKSTQKLLDHGFMPKTERKVMIVFFNIHDSAVAIHRKKLHEKCFRHALQRIFRHRFGRIRSRTPRFTMRKGSGSGCAQMGVVFSMYHNRPMILSDFFSEYPIRLHRLSKSTLESSCR